MIERDGGGRTYAGMPTNWGQDFTVLFAVGAVTWLALAYTDIRRARDSR